MVVKRVTRKRLVKKVRKTQRGGAVKALQSLFRQKSHTDPNPDPLSHGRLPTFAALSKQAGVSGNNPQFTASTTRSMLNTRGRTGLTGRRPSAEAPEFSPPPQMRPSMLRKISGSQTAPKSRMKRLF